jgi:protein TonB
VITIKKSGEITEQEAVPYSLIECAPKFDGGDTQEFSKWVNSQLKYPEQAKQNGIQGRVTLQFTVGVDGMVRNVSVLRGAHELLDTEAFKVISSSPRWEPGKQQGEAVPVTFIFPVIFQLR